MCRHNAANLDSSHMAIPRPLQYIESLRELLYDLESSPPDAPGPDVLAAYKQHVSWLGREMRAPEVRFQLLRSLLRRKRMSQRGCERWGLD